MWFSFEKDLAHDDPRRHGKAEPVIKVDDRLIGGQNEQLSLAHAAIAQPFFGRLDDLAAQARTTRVGVGCHVIEPAPVPVVTHHDASLHLAGFVEADQNV